MKPTYPTGQGDLQLAVNGVVAWLVLVGFLAGLVWLISVYG